MKRLKKWFSMFCAVCMLFSSLTVNAAATSASEESLIQYLEQLNSECSYVNGFVSQADELANLGNENRDSIFSETSTCTVPYNDGSGTSGIVVCEFTAEETTARFTLDVVGNQESYHCRIYRVFDSGTESPLGKEIISTFGYGPEFNGLVAGELYRVYVSSMDVPVRGARGTYTINTTPSKD